MTAPCEVVSHEEAAGLPAGSRVVSTGYYDDLPEPGARVAVIGNPAGLRSLTGPRKWVVLHRAEVPTFAVGDKVTTAEQLDRLPSGAVLRDSAGDVLERGRGPDDKPGAWYATGTVNQQCVRIPARILDLPLWT